MTAASLKFLWRSSVVLCSGKRTSQGSTEILEADSIFSGTLNSYNRRK